MFIADVFYYRSSMATMTSLFFQLNLIVLRAWLGQNSWSPYLPNLTGRLDLKDVLVNLTCVMFKCEKFGLLTRTDEFNPEMGSEVLKRKKFKSQKPNLSRQSRSRRHPSLINLHFVISISWLKGFKILRNPSKIG